METSAIDIVKTFLALAASNHSNKEIPNYAEFALNMMNHNKLDIVQAPSINNTLVCPENIAPKKKRKPSATARQKQIIKLVNECMQIITGDVITLATQGGETLFYADDFADDMIRQGKIHLNEYHNFVSHLKIAMKNYHALTCVNAEKGIYSFADGDFERMISKDAANENDEEELVTIVTQ